jgi:hypothetical protein
MGEIDDVGGERNGQETGSGSGRPGTVDDWDEAAPGIWSAISISWRRLAVPAITVVLVAVVVSFTATLMPGDGGGDQVSTVQADSGSPVPTNKWVNFYGLESTIDGQALPVGAEITAWDPQGVLCGRFVVTDAGRYGLMAVYGDDPLTDIDEGAVPGDWLDFRVNGVDATSVGPDEPTWTAMGDLRQVDLTVLVP